MLQFVLAEFESSRFLVRLNLLLHFRTEPQDLPLSILILACERLIDAPHEETELLAVLPLTRLLSLGCLLRMHLAVIAPAASGGALRTQS